MRLEKYINEKKMLSGTMIGFGVERSRIKNILDYVESWMKRYEIESKMNTEFHFTLAQITGKYRKDELVREMDKISANITFKPKQVSMLKGVNVKRDFIVLEYKSNNKYVNELKEIASKYEVRMFGSIRPHISICNMEQNKMDKKLFDDIVYSFPKLPLMKVENIELWNNKFEMEYAKGV